MQSVNDFLFHYLWSSPKTAAGAGIMLTALATTFVIWALEQAHRAPLQLLSEIERPRRMVEQTAVNTSGILGALVVTNLLLGAILGVLLFGAMR